MTPTDAARRVTPLAAPPFVFPREPHLGWRLLNPLARSRPLPAPFDTKPTFYLFWARNGLYHGLRVLGLAPGDGVLVPAFHCLSVVEPLLHYGATVRFYRIDTSCTPDLDDIRSRIDERTRAVLAIHYFGFPRLIRELRDLCTRRGLFLIEDCAHLLAGRSHGDALGEFGDISVFSCRKFLPVYDGGQLVVNNPTLTAAPRLAPPSAVLRLRVWKNILDKLIDDAPGPGMRHLSGFLRWLSAMGRCLFIRRTGAAPSSTINTYSPDFDPSSLDLEMSAPSRKILHTVDIEAIIEARRRHYRALLSAAADLPDLLPVFPDLPEGVCPWIFPVIARGRSAFHLRLRARGIPATTWGGVIHRDLPIEDFPDAAFLYEHLIFLPIHQSLTPADLQAMIAVIAAELSRPS